MIFPGWDLLRSMKNWWHIIEKFLGVYRWHPKIALRYLPVVSEINRLFPHASPLVLEIGSGGLGITPYYKKPVVGVDLNFSPPLDSQLIPVRASAMDLPFADNSFEVVISLDMLEHISPKERPQAVKEMVRVARSLVCVGVPCGRLAHEQDEKLEKVYKKKHGVNFHFLSEQVEYGIPEKEEILTLLKQTGEQLDKRFLITTRGNINLSVRWWLMEGWISKNFIVNIFFRKILLLFLPILLRLNQPPTYRQLFIGTIQKT